MDSIDGRGGAREGSGPPKQGTPEALINERYKTARAIREAQRAKIAELQLKRLEGSLVDRSDYERAAFLMGQYLQRNLVDILPGAIAMELASLSTAAEIERLLRDRIRVELAQLSTITVDELISDRGRS